MACSPRLITAVGRLVVKSKRWASNLTVQAQDVMMTKLGLRDQPQQNSADENVEFDEYLAFVWWSDLCVRSKREAALRMLFPTSSAIDNIQLVEGVEPEVL